MTIELGDNLVEQIGDERRKVWVKTIEELNPKYNAK